MHIHSSREELLITSGGRLIPMAYLDLVNTMPTSSLLGGWSGMERDSLSKGNSWVCTDRPSAHIHVLLDIAPKSLMTMHYFDLLQQSIKKMSMHIFPSLLLVCPNVSKKIWLLSRSAQQPQFHDFRPSIPLPHRFGLEVSVWLILYPKKGKLFPYLLQTIPCGLEDKSNRVIIPSHGGLCVLHDFQSSVDLFLGCFWISTEMTFIELCIDKQGQHVGIWIVKELPYDHQKERPIRHQLTFCSDTVYKIRSDLPNGSSQSSSWVPLDHKLVPKWRLGRPGLPWCSWKPIFHRPGLFLVSYQFWYHSIGEHG